MALLHFGLRSAIDESASLTGGREASTIFFDFYSRINKMMQQSAGTVAQPGTAARRRELLFASGDDHCHAWLYLPEPDADSAPPPVIVMAHGLGGLKCGGLEPFAERFRAAGYACLVFDYRHFGESTGQPRELLDIDKQREDWRAAVACARSLGSVDASRVVVWGTSFAGGHAIATAAGDSEVAAMIAQCPFTDGPASSLATPIPTAMAIFVLAVRDHISRITNREPIRVATAGRAGTTALMTEDHAWEELMAINRAAGLSDEPTLVPARIATQILFDVPGRLAKRISCPALFIICAKDSVAPAKTTLRHALRAPHVEIRWLQEGHFSIYLGDAFERNIKEQLIFLQTYVPIRPSEFGWTDRRSTPWGPRDQVPSE